MVGGIEVVSGFVARAARDGQMVRASAPDGRASRAAAEAQSGLEREREAVRLSVPSTSTERHTARPLVVYEAHVRGLTRCRDRPDAGTYGRSIFEIEVGVLTAADDSPAGDALAFGLGYPADQTFAEIESAELIQAEGRHGQQRLGQRGEIVKGGRLDRVEARCACSTGHIDSFPSSVAEERHRRTGPDRRIETGAGLRLLHRRSQRL